ncbi:MAG: S-methyl-5-thioribose-1-phosphate isomerase [Candidatus Omnitrophica bacterium]|nr:S-methyl-5-thioribose-1-phosphate isomerase [Candidatus Omnitrophota bacterium]
MYIQTIQWQNDAIKIIDQTKLPNKLQYLYIRDLVSLWQAIRMMKIRGAPALGAAAALGVYLGLKDSRARQFDEFMKELGQVINYIGSCRPTARNIFWASERMRTVVLNHKEKSVEKLKRLLYQEAKRIIQEEKLTCRKLSIYGQTLIRDKDRILTICNAGILATIDYGTALGVIYCAYKRKKRIKVFVCETRPLLQGARLTTWELKRRGIDTTLICDAMAATLIKAGNIDKIITGADRIASNGDIANKVGTYNLAVLAKYHKIPFYVAAPTSTFDLDTKNGKDIPIEKRPDFEVIRLFFKKPIAVSGIKVFNPAFDVTPYKLITAIVTERGIISPPYHKNILEVLKKKDAFR